MKWFFTPPAESDPSPHRDDDQAPGLIGLPAALLQRHGARVLDPGKAVRLSGDQPPRPTVYRAKTLLVPDVVRQDDDVRRTITTVLADIGIELITPSQPRPPRRIRLLPQLPRTAVLVPVLGHPTPVVVDAWVALQTLRADGIAQERPDRDTEAVEQISLEHLLVGSAITGSPARRGRRHRRGPRHQRRRSAGRPPPTPTCSAAATRGPRSPSSSIRPRAGRPTNARADYGRRPVVAVLDTGVRAHPWLDVAAGRGGRLHHRPPTASSRSITASRPPSTRKAQYAPG